MAADVQIRFRADSKSAQREIQQLQKEIAELRQSLGQTQRSADAAEKGVQQFGEQSRQTARSVDVLETQMNAVRRETLSYRTSISSLNAELAENRNALLTADAAAKKTLETRNRQIRAEAGLLRARQQTSALTLSALQQERRELGGLVSAQTGATRSTGLLSRAAGELVGNLSSFAVFAATDGLVEFARGTVRAAGRLELLKTGLENVTGNSAAAAQRLRELDEIARLPGANLDTLIQYNNRLTAIGLTGEEIDSVLLNVGQSIVSLGGNAVLADQSLEQISQALQQNIVDLRDFRPVIQRIPGFLQAVADVHGVDASLDGMREAVDNLGGSVKDALLPVLEELGDRFAAPPPESYVRSLDELHNAFFLFSASLGNLVLPAVSSVARGLAELFDEVRNFLEPTLFATKSADEFAEAISGTTASVKELLPELDEYIRRLDQRANNPRAAVSSDDLKDLAAAKDLYNLVSGALDGNTESIAELETRTSAAKTALEGYNAEQARLKKAIDDVDTEIRSERDSLQGLNDDLIINTERVTAAESEYNQLNRVFTAVNEETNTLRQSLSALEAPTANASAATHSFIDSINDFGGALNQIDTRFLTFHERVAAFQGTIRGLPPKIAAVRSGFDVLAPTAERVAAIFDNLNTSLVSSQREVNALDVVTQQILQDLQDLEGLAHVRVVIAERTDVHNANLINQGIADAVRSFRDYNDVLLEAGVNFRNIDDISEDVTASIRDQASAFDELRSSVAGVSQAQSGLQGQQLGSGVFDQFQARTPGSDFGTSFADNLRPLQAQIGQELGSQAIRTAGELKRIEQDRVESLEDLEREYSEQIIAINEEKRQKLAEVEQAIEAERVRRLASIEEAFEDAKNAEIEARQEAADRILVIEQKAAEDRQRLRERLNDRLIALEQRRDDRIQDLTDGFIEREQDRQQEVLEITERAADARVEAEQAYAAEVQSINNRLVEDVLTVQRELAEEIESLESGFVARQADRADEIVHITQEAADARATANQTFAETMEGIYNDLVTAWDALEEGFTERQADRAEERIEIEQRAVDARVAANKDYADSVARISTELVDEVRRIESEIVDVQQRHAEDRLAIEQESIEDRAEVNADYARQVEEIEENRDRRLVENTRRLAEIQQEASDARLAADERYADRFQDIQNDLVDRVVGIQRDLNDTLNDLRDEQLSAESDRQQRLVDLHEETQQKLEDLERSRTQTIEDLRRKFQQDQLDAAIALDRDLRDAEGDPEKEAAARQKFQRRIEDLTREFHRRSRDLQITQQREREALARQAAAKEVEIAERAAAELSGISQQQTDAQTQAELGISDAESAAGVAFRDAQANYVPALSAHEQALLAHADALDRIATTQTEDTGEATAARAAILQESFNATAAAGTTLAETLTRINQAEQTRLTTLGTQTTERVEGLQNQITDAEGRAGLSFDEALANYTPAVDLNTQALNALNATLAEIDTDETSGLADITAAGTADRATTDTAQQALATDAGVSIEAARANFVPALSTAAQATLTLNATMQALDTSFRETIAEIQETGRVDRQATDAAIQEAVDAAVARQTALETDAGTTFADASAAFQPGVSDIAQATLDRDTAITGIDDSEISDIDSVNAQSLTDRLETDAAITEARDVYIKARDAEILKHNTAILQLNIAEAADIKAVRATLSKNLESIDDKLDTELAEIRETKIVFDTRMNELITAINAEANQDITGLKADTAAMRSSLEAIAADARDNAWKEALLKMANVGITVAGVAAGTALGNPVAGLAAGQAVGGLVEQAGNELFHFPRTDVISRQVARADTLRRSRQTPNYLPDANQIRNARDLSREIVAGVNEGLSIGNRGGGIGAQQPQSRFPVDNEELRADITLEFPDGTIQELNNQMLRLKQQDRA